MFPVQTKMIRNGVASSGLSAAKFMSPLCSTFPSSTPARPGDFSRFPLPTRQCPSGWHSLGLDEEV